MKAYLDALWGEFVNFIGGGAGAAHWGLFLAALIGTFFLGRRERRKIFYPSLLVLLLFFNPLFYRYVGTRFLPGVYWRLLWMLPVSFAVAYVATRLLFVIPRRALRVAAAALACAVIFATGAPVFSRETYSEKENAYELPAAAIGVADTVDAWRTDAWKETMVAPSELLCSIRQYSPSACLLYGRNSGGFILDIGEDEEAVFGEMNKLEPDLGLIDRVAREKNCRFLVFNTAFHNVTDEGLGSLGYKRIATIEEDYAVYRRGD